MPTITSTRGVCYRVPPGTSWTSARWVMERRTFQAGDRNLYGIYSRDLEIIVPPVMHLYIGSWWVDGKALPGYRCILGWDPTGKALPGCIDLSGLCLEEVKT